MADRTIFAVIPDDCNIETLSRAQILTAIEQAIENGAVSDPNGAIISKIKETNADATTQLWIGTETEFNALSPAPVIHKGVVRIGTNGVLYLCTDDTTYEKPDAVLLTPQTLTAEQQAQARANIGAVTETNEDYLTYSAQALTAEEQAQARQNLGISYEIADGSIATAKLADGAVTAEKLETSSVTTAKLAYKGVTTAKIADGAVTTSKIPNGAVTPEKLSNPFIVPTGGTPAQVLMKSSDEDFALSWEDAIAPANMILFTATSDYTTATSRIRLNCSLPESSSSCSVAGAVIRRSTTSYPASETDGDFVMDISGDGAYYDSSDIDNNTTYYYSSFPYSNKNVYKRSEANRSSALYNPPAPSDMTAFMAASDYTVATNRVRLSCLLPESTEICIVTGAMIRRSTTSYPATEADGDFVMSVTSNGDYYDSSNIAADETYYYSAFPYNALNVYQRSEENRSAATYSPTAPANMITFTATSDYENFVDRVKLACALPASTETCIVTGAMIRRSTTGYPATETDGDLVANITANGNYYDTATITVNTTYYYAAFPYNVKGTYTRSSANRTENWYQRTYIYGYDLAMATSNPSDRVTYPDDVDNADYTPAAMDYIAGEFNYGSWTLAAGEHFMPRPCMLKYDGTVDYYLDPNDYSKKSDGVTASDVGDPSYGGNAMMEWPRIYTKRWEENGVYKFRCSNIPVNATWDCWCNYDRLDNVIDHFYTAIYTGIYLGSDILRSKSGYAPTTGRKGNDHMAAAARNGEDWTIDVVSDRFLIQDLCVLMSKTTDSQTAFGRGNVSPTSLVLNAGSMNDKGLFWGASSDIRGVKIFGMENWWGNVERFIAGWCLNYGKHLLKLTRGTYDGTTVTDYNDRGYGYLNVDDIIGRNEFITETDVKDYGRLPINGAANGGGLYECDYFNAPVIYEGTMASCGGGKSNSEESSGLFSVTLNRFYDENYSQCGSALSCKPCLL